MKKTMSGIQPHKKDNTWETRLAYSDQDRETGDGEGFAYRPFRKLAPNDFPPCGKALHNEGQNHIVEDSDQKMFLDAMASDIFAPGEKLRSGFLLSNQCRLPDLGSKKVKKSKPPKTEPTTRPVDDEDSAAFLLAMRKTKPLSGKGRAIAPKPALREKTARDPDFEELMATQLQFALLYSDEYLEGRVTSLDDLLMNRLREGQMSPEAHLDLHGLNAEQAFEAMRAFIRDAWFKSLRVVLLVPGRGKNSPDGQGVLRRKVQQWLTHEPFKRVVLAFCTASPHDGGPGSIYVLLRKFRKKGHISWDSLPADADLYSHYGK